MPTPAPSWINAVVQAARWGIRRVRPDHSSLFGGWYQQNYSNRQHFYVAVACAPTRRFRRPRSIEPDAVLAFLEELMPGVFAFPAAQSMKDVVAFEVLDAAAGPLAEYEPIHAARVWSNGRVELFTRAPCEFDRNDRATIDLAEAFVPLFRLAQLVQRGAYRRLFGLATRRRRLDWFVALSNTRSDATRGSEEWGDLRFPGRAPKARAKRHYAAAPTFGLGSSHLRSRSQHDSPTSLVQPAINELVSESGWHDGNSDAVADAVAAVETRTVDLYGEATA